MQIGRGPGSAGRTRVPVSVVGTEGDPWCFNLSLRNPLGASVGSEQVAALVEQKGRIERWRYVFHASNLYADPWRKIARHAAPSCGPAQAAA